MKSIASRFNTHRMLQEYTNRFYKPAGEKWQYLKKDSMTPAKQLAQWKAKIKSIWGLIKIQNVEINSDEEYESELDISRNRLKVGAALNVTTQIYLDQAEPGDLSVQLYYGKVNPGGNITNGTAIPMHYVPQNNTNETHCFQGTLRLRDSGRQGFAVRVLPNNPDLTDSRDMGLVLWEKKSERQFAQTSAN